MKSTSNSLQPQSLRQYGKPWSTSQCFIDKLMKALMESPYDRVFYGESAGMGASKKVRIDKTKSMCQPEWRFFEDCDEDKCHIWLNGYTRVEL